MEAAVTLFSKSGKLGGKLARMAEHDPEYLLGSGTVSSYYSEKIAPLAESLKTSIPVKNVEVLRVNKRFLAPEEIIEGRSRLADLFRVVYRVDPTEMVKSQKEENPELYQNFDEAMMKSLGEEMEAFEDFDMVVDASGIMDNPLHLGPGGAPALNEKGLSSKGHVYYGWECTEFFKELPETGHVVISGHDEPAALAVLELKDWLKESGHRLSLVCETAHPFKNLTEGTQKKIDLFMGAEEAAFIKKMEAYREKLFAWRELEDYIKAKTPQPAEPRPPFDVLVNSYVTSVDRLMDKEGWFLTVESPAFKGEESLKTLKADVVLGLKGFKKQTSLSEDLQTHYNFSKTNSAGPDGLHPEPGFYTLGGSDLESGLEQVGPIIDNMLSFFSKVEN